MSASYDPHLSTDRDWVRRLIGDTNVTGTNAKLQDEELDALLTESEASSGGGGRHVRYLAAAAALELLLSRWRAAGDGQVEKSLGPLRIKRGGGISGGGEEDVVNAISELRKQGAAIRLSSATNGSAGFGVL